MGKVNYWPVLGITLDFAFDRTKMPVTLVKRGKVSRCEVMKGRSNRTSEWP